MNLKSVIHFPFRKIRAFLKFSKTARAILAKRNRPTIWLFGAPNHSNLGDQAQSFCIEQWAKRTFPQHDFFVFVQFGAKEGKFLLKILRKVIKKTDFIFCHSGYHMTELYPLYKIYEEVVKTFPDFPIVVFPQTVNFRSSEESRRVASIFDGHPNCTLLCRDEISFASAQKIFRKTKLLLYPDIVTSLIGTRRYAFPRNGILFCMRNDKEAFYTPEQIRELRKRFTDIKTEISDTTIPLPAKDIIENRKAVLEATFEKYAHYQAIITDRYHGTIFSLVARTPVIVVASSDHKLSSGVNWFPKEIFGNYISFAKDLDEAFEFAQNRIAFPPENALPPYFKEKYYDALVEKIDLKRQ